MCKNVFCGILCGLLLCFQLFLAGCGSKAQDVASSSEAEQEVRQNEAYVEEIKGRGYLIAGCKTDVPGLSFYDKGTDTWSGLEIELAYQTAARIFAVSADEARKQGLVRFVGVTVADREEKLEQGEVDCLFATYTITEERGKRFAFSESYYTDYIGLMVKDSGENPNALGRSDIMSIADLDGKKIGVPRKATTREALLKYIDMMNTQKASPLFFEYDGYEALFAALKEGTIDVMAVDVSILGGYVDSSTKILDDRFGGQHYGAAVRKENVKLLEFINGAVGE